MFKTGECIIYGSTGVCEVTGITKINNIKGVDQDTTYYILKPLFQNGTIYTPVDNPKVFMRPVISKEKAENLINMIPAFEAEAYHNKSVQQLTEHYETAIQSHDCADLVELVMSIYAKKQSMEQQNKKVGKVDEHFMKRAKDLLHSELSVALGIPLDDVPEYIASKVASVSPFDLEVK